MIKDKNLGTTLIEVIVALFVVGITITGSIFIITTSFKSISVMKDNLMAQNFSREGIETVKKIVNTNYIRYVQKECWNFDWKKGLPCGQAHRLENSYKLEYAIDNGQFLPSLETVNANLDLSKTLTTNQQYLISTADNQKKFYRMIKISYDVANADKMLIESIIQWKRGDEKNEFIMSDLVFNKY